jgi:hypothetical protein
VRLGVRRRGFALEAAERVFAGAGIASSDILDLLDSLSRNSLLTVGREGEAARFGMLETIRQFSGDRLVDWHEAAATRRCHARFMGDDSECHSSLWRSPRQRASHARLDREIGNLRLAFRWAMQHADVDVAARIASNIGDMGRHCLRDEAAGWAAEVVDAACKLKHRRLCVLLNWAGSSACAAARHDEARRFAEQAVALVDDPDAARSSGPTSTWPAWNSPQGSPSARSTGCAGGAAHPADRQDRYVAACLLAIMATGEGVAEARRLADGIVRDVDAAGAPGVIVVAHIRRGEVLADVDPTAALAEMAFAIETARASGCRFLESYFTPRFAAMQGTALLAHLGEAVQRIRDTLGEADFAKGYFEAHQTVWLKTSVEFIVWDDWAYERYTYRSVDTPRPRGPAAGTPGGHRHRQRHQRLPARC